VDYREKQKKVGKKSHLGKLKQRTGKHVSNYDSHAGKNPLKNKGKPNGGKTGEGADAERNERGEVVVDPIRGPPYKPCGGIPLEGAMRGRPKQKTPLHQNREGQWRVRGSKKRAGKRVKLEDSPTVKGNGLYPLEKGEGVTLILI